MADKKSLRLELSDELLQSLDHIAELAGRTRSDVVRGMVEHWAAVLADHEARGFYVVPVAGRSFASAMVADRAGAFDAGAPAAGGPAAPGDIS